jgi:hypothetical protein
MINNQTNLNKVNTSNSNTNNSNNFNNSNKSNTTNNTSNSNTNNTNNFNNSNSNKSNTTNNTSNSNTNNKSNNFNNTKSVNTNNKSNNTNKSVNSNNTNNFNNNKSNNTKSINNKDNKYQKISLILGILIFVIIIIFIFIIIVSWYSINDDPITFANTKNGEFLFTCNEYQCDDGYTCDSNYLICKKDVGYDCNNFLECANDLFCSGICATGPTGSLNAFCPCIPGETTCVNISDTTNEKNCRLNVGKPCTKITECASNNCSGGICVAGYINSAPCKISRECASSFCSKTPGEAIGYCQNPGIISSSRGSACKGECYSGIAGAICGDSLTCVCDDEITGPGICKNINLGISVNCSNLAKCSDNLVCINAIGSYSTCTGDFINNGNTGITGLDICSCGFNYFVPNTPIKDICINGMTANSNTCYNSKNLGCNSNDMCKSSCDNKTPVLATYNFSNTNSESNKHPGVNFINSIDTSINAIPINPITTPITTPFSPITLFSTSNITIDTIFLVDKNNGLLYLVNTNDKNNKTWNQILQSNTLNPTGQNRTLKYVAFNGIFWILLFDETSSSPTNDIYTSLYWTTSKSENDTNIPNITNMKYFDLKSPDYNTSYPGRQYYKTYPSVANATAYNGSYIDIAPLNYFSDVSANNDIYSNNLIFSQKVDNITYLPFSYNNQKNTEYFLYIGDTKLDLKLRNSLPVKYYYGQDINVTENPGTTEQKCDYNTIEYCINNNTDPGGSTGNNCNSYLNFIFGSNSDDLTYSPLPITFSGNFVNNYYPIIGNGTSIYYRVFDYSLYSPGATGLYTYSKDTNICDLGNDNSNIIMLCESYSKKTPPESLGNVVVVVNKQTITTLPYKIDNSFKCAASDNAFYIISSGSCT